MMMKRFEVVKWMFEVVEGERQGRAGWWLTKDGVENVGNLVDGDRYIFGEFNWRRGSGSLRVEKRSERAKKRDMEDIEDAPVWRKLDLIWWG